MSGYDRMGSYVLKKLGEGYRINKLDIGADAELSKSGMRFSTSCYEVEGLGRLCIMTMNAMMGLMKMETVVLSAFTKDAPLLNLDWVKAMGKETFMAEFYDCCLSPLPEELGAAYAAIKAKDADIPEYESGPHWYDDIKLPFSYGKTGKGYSQRFTEAGRAYFDEYMRQLELLADCGAEAKAEKVRGFAETLFKNGGPAVDQVKKLFGDETAQRLIVKHMYGC
ncbi:MAG: hypothetical protein II971_00510 [Firmicutes bacterium]|nr:hypothetical protein [Bacillota bacterium]